MYYSDFGLGVSCEMGELVGASLGLCLIVWILGIKFKNYKLIIFSILLFLLSTYDSIKMYHKGRNAKALMSQIATIGKEVLTKGEIPNIEIKDNEYAPLMEITKRVFEKQIEMQNSFEMMDKEMSNCNLELMFDPDTLSNKEEFTRALNNINNAALLLNKYENLYKSKMNEIENIVINANLPALDKKSFLNGFYNSKKIGEEQINILFSAWKELVVEIENTLKFIQKNKGHFYFQGEKILFDSQDRIDTYNAQIIKIRYYGKQLQEIGIKIQNNESTFISDPEKYFQRR